MTTLVQKQNDHKPAWLAGFTLLFAIAIFFAATYRGTASSTVAEVKPVPQIQYQPHAVEWSWPVSVDCGRLVKRS